MKKNLTETFLDKEGNECFKAFEPKEIVNKQMQMNCSNYSKMLQSSVCLSMKESACVETSAEPLSEWWRLQGGFAIFYFQRFDGLNA